MIPLASGSMHTSKGRASAIRVRSGDNLVSATPRVLGKSSVKHELGIVRGN